MGGVQDDGSSLYVTFKDPAAINYAFGAAWVQDQQGVRDLDGFRKWLDTQSLNLNK